MQAAVVRVVLVVACLLVAQSSAWAQATIAGLVSDASGAVLPGVTVEASSPALIEKVRTAVTDGNGRYRIENLFPGDYTVTFSLAGFATVRREGLLVSGTTVIAVDADMKVGGVQETITVTGETPIVDVQSATPRDHARQRNHSQPAGSPQLQLSRQRRSGRFDQRQQRAHRADLLDLPDPRRPRRRIAPHRRRPEHQQPARRQPAAELHCRHGQRAGSHDDHVGWSRRDGNRRPDDEHRPEAGWQQVHGSGLCLRFLGGDAGEQLHRRAEGARRQPADPD